MKKYLIFSAFFIPAIALFFIGCYVAKTSSIKMGSLFFIACFICGLSYAMYGALYKNFGEKHFNIVQKTPIPFRLFLGKTETTYVFRYKILVFTSLITLIIVLALMIMSIINNR